MNSNNVQSLLDAANQYQIEPVKKMCVDFLKNKLMLQTVLVRNEIHIKKKHFKKIIK